MANERIRPMNDDNPDPVLSYQPPPPPREPTRHDTLDRVLVGGCGCVLVLMSLLGFLVWLTTSGRRVIDSVGVVIPVVFLALGVGAAWLALRRK